MNTTIAIISIIVITNWTRIGEFKDTAGRTFDVQEGRLQTKTVVDVPWNDLATSIMSLHNNETGKDSDVPVIVEHFQTNRFTLKSVDGPIVGERKIEITNVVILATNIPYMPWWYFPSNRYYLTNTPVNLSESVNAILKTNTIQSAIAHGYGSELDALLWSIWTGKTNVLLTNREYFTTNVQWIYEGKKVEPKQIPYPPIYTFTNGTAQPTNMFLWRNGKKTYAIPAIKLED